MAQVSKIESNKTGLRYAEEETIGVLPTTPVWIPAEPNSYNEFGGEFTNVARNPINADRQRRKGVTTDLDASGGFNTDMLLNLQVLMQGYFFADLRRKGEEIVTAVDTDTSNPDEYEVASTTGFQVNDLIQGSNFSEAGNNTVNLVTAIVSDVSVEVVDGVLTAEPTPPADAQITVIGHELVVATADIVVSGTWPRLVRASGALDYTTFGIIPGEWIFVGGDGASEDFLNAENNGWKRVREVGAAYIEFDKSDIAMTAETGTGLTIRLFLGRVLKNELGTSIVRRSYQLERQLGAPDDASLSDIQAEYVIGGIPSEMTINIPSADKVNIDFSFVGTDHTTIDGPTSLKTGTRPAIPAVDAFNTSSDFSRIKMAVYTAGSEAPTALFAFVTELTINLSNNVTPNKAVGTLGAFDVSAGIFQIGGSLTAYFANVSAIAAVRSNADVTIDFVIAANNTGLVMDIPLMSLGGGRADVAQDEPITLPITMEAGSGVAVDTALDYTALCVFFDYLPTAAQ